MTVSASCSNEVAQIREAIDGLNHLSTAVRTTRPPRGILKDCSAWWRDRGTAQAEPEISELEVPNGAS